MILTDENSKLQAVLAGAVTGSELTVVVSYEEHFIGKVAGETGTSTKTSNNDFIQASETNSTTLVDILDSPEVDYKRQVKNLTVYNKSDTATTVSIIFYDGTDSFIIVKSTIQIGETLQYNRHDGWRVIDAQGRIKTSLSAFAENIEDAINDGVTDKAPSENAVYDALQTKLDKKPNLTSIDDTGIADDEIAIFDLTNKKIKTSDKTFSTSITLVDNSDDKISTQKATKAYIDSALRQGDVVNGKIVVTVAANNITVSIKTLADADPSASAPVYVKIQNTIRAITSALSVTLNAGTKWFNAGGAELATFEVDYFVYLGYNATDGVVIGFSRITGSQYGDFSTTSTDETYAAISTITNAVSTDYYEIIGRFAATLSAGPGYAWTVPTFDADNLKQFPIRHTRVLTSTGASTGFSSMTNDTIMYMVIERAIHIINIQITGTSNATTFTHTLPFATTSGAKDLPLGRGLNNGVGTISWTRITSASNIATVSTSVIGGLWTASGTKQQFSSYVYYRG